MGLPLESMVRQESIVLVDRLIQKSLDEGDGWIHKYTKDEKKQSPVICSDLIVKGLPTQDTNTIRQIFKGCGDITRIEAGKEGNTP